MGQAAALFPLRAAPKKLVPDDKALASPPVNTFTNAGNNGVVGARARRVMESGRMITSFLCSAVRLFHQLNVARCGFVKGKQQLHLLPDHLIYFSGRSSM